MNNLKIANTVPFAMKKYSACKNQNTFSAQKITHRKQINIVVKLINYLLHSESKK